MATGNFASMAIGGGDPRLDAVNNATDKKMSIDAGVNGSFVEGPPAYEVSPKVLKIRDPKVTWQEYYFWAQRARAEEDTSLADEPGRGAMGMFQFLFPSKNDTPIDPSAYKNISSREKPGDAAALTITDEEWLNAQRAIRTASGAATFYLITTDILGPFGLAFSFGTVGWVPGCVLFTIFAILAGYSGYLLNRMFLGMDSYRFPLRSYGDAAYRIYGNIARIPINILQSIQLILTVALITITNGQALSLITKFKLCYVVCVVILVVCGMVIGQIRTLQKFGWLANVAVFFNLCIMGVTMAVAYTSLPNYGAAQLLSAGAFVGDGSVTPTAPYPPLKHYVGMPQTGSFVAALNGIMNTVFAYGGANVFNEFMAEMKRPRDFLWAMWTAQFFIWAVYMLYGLWMYAFQAQYSVNPSPQSISPYWAIVVANIFYILSAGIAAALYGNIGLKVLYNNIFVELLRCPPLVTRAGKIIWIVLIPVYWAVAFVIGAVIPNFSALVGVVGALCITQFTYSLPPLLYIGFKIRENALQPGEGYDPVSGKVVKHDKGLKRFFRGLTGGTWLDKGMMGWNVLYMLGALSMAGLGAYASIEGIIESFKAGASITTFSCRSPLDFVSL